VPRGCSSSLETQMIWHSQHWLAKGKKQMSCVPNEETKQKKKCDCGLCVVSCFELWHTKTQL
jgi:hypothetical protein